MVYCILCILYCGILYSLYSVLWYIVFFVICTVVYCILCILYCGILYSLYSVLWYIVFFVIGTVVYCILYCHILYSLYCHASELGLVRNNEYSELLLGTLRYVNLPKRIARHQSDVPMAQVALSVCTFSSWTMSAF